MKILIIFIISYWSIANVFGQDKKYAFLLQNRSFDSWSDFKELKGNTLAVKELLLEQGFLEKNITECKDLTANGFRLELQKFINKIPEGAICVVFLGSHGGQIKDVNGDELLRDKKDTLDEFFVCKDTPAQSNTVSVKKNNDDFIENAIIDDELGKWNDKILEKIKQNGQYLLLADYCHSDSSEKSGDGNSFESLKDGIEFVDFEVLQSAKNSVYAPFFVFAATNTTVPIADSPVSFFVSSLQHAFHFFKFSKPNYSELFEQFRPTILPLLKEKKGKPTLNVLIKSDTLAKVFNSDWYNVIEIQASSIVKYTKSMFGIGTKGINTKVSFELEKSYLYQKGMYIDIFKDNIFLSEGIVDDVKSDSLVIDILSEFRPKLNETFEIKSSNRFIKATEKLSKINKKIELNSVLKILSDSSYKVGIEACVNQYITPKRGDKTKPTFNENCIKLIQIMDLDTLDNITLNISNPQILYYTIVDVTKTYGLKHCFIDTTNIKPAILGFRNQHEKFYSRVTSPYGKSSLWLLITDKIIEDTSFDIYLLGTDINENDKDLLWNNIIKHIKYFEEIDYNVVESK